MDISVLVSWKNVNRPFGWTIGPCPYCNAVTAGRIDEVVQQIALYFIPVYSTRVGYQCRCDLCERPLADFLPEKRLALNEWDHSLGLPQIAVKLGVPPPPEPSDPDLMIDSMLSSIAERTTLNALDISLGLTSGCILGAIAGCALGYTVLPRYLNQMDLLGCIFAGILGGLIVGGVLGASISAYIQRSSLPYEQVNAAFRNYRLDPEKIVRIAEKYPMRVYKAVLRARDDSALRPRPGMS
jgi:bacterioferritin-associated ferredoxin